MITMSHRKFIRRKARKTEEKPQTVVSGGQRSEKGVIEKKLPKNSRDMTLLRQCGKPDKT